MTVNLEPLAPEREVWLALAAGDDPALAFWVRRDLLDEDPGPAEQLWELPAVMRILTKQRDEGCWAYKKRKHGYPNQNYDLLETYRQLRVLVDQYGLTRSHPAVERAAGYVLAHQTEAGDIRGIFGAQPAHHYCSGLLELLIRAGYDGDPRVERGLVWLLDQRQDDGGWAYPMRTAKVSYDDAISRPEPVEGDRSKPFSHMLTGFVIRSLAAHPSRRHEKAVRRAGELLKARFFQADKYPDRRTPDYWTKFQYPFWWGNLLTALDSLRLIGFTAGDPDVAAGLDWFRQRRDADGLWPTGYGAGNKAAQERRWVGLAIGRVLRQYAEAK